MTAAAHDPWIAVQSLAESLLIGLLVGVQRESTSGIHPGLRDFILIGLAGGVCGVVGQPWLSAVVLVTITAVLGVFHVENRRERTGITTELAAIATFCLTYMTSIPDLPMAAPIAIGSAIAMTAFLEFKKRLELFFRETITQQEFNGTLAFLAVVLVIYPLLPAGRYGPYQFFAPREVWFYVILISVISYCGYFFQKFLGAERGLDYTAVLGGVASTLATTMDLARRSRHDPANSPTYARAAVMANTVQFPRTLVILLAASQAMAKAGAIPMLTSLAAGALLSWLFRRWVKDVHDRTATPGNPFRVRPALTFGALFALVVLLNKAANAELGWLAVYGTSALGGLVDVGTVVVSSSDLLERGAVTGPAAISYVFAALGANILMKAVVAITAGTAAFAWRLVAALLLMFGSGLLAWLTLS